MSAGHDDLDDDMMRTAFARNREQMRFPATSGWSARIGWKRVETAVAEAAKQQIVLDYSATSAASLEELISSWEFMIRVATDLDDGEYVGDQLGGVLDLPALGVYYGELFVRHAGATWGEAVGESGLEPAVIRGGVTVLPLDIVRRRATDGRHVDLVGIFEREKAAMTAN
jgi:hypothetical protein